MRELKIGEHVSFVAEDGSTHDALVTFIHEPEPRADGGGHMEKPALDLVTIEVMEFDEEVPNPAFVPPAPAPEPEPEPIPPAEGEPEPPAEEPAPDGEPTATVETTEPAPAPVPETITVKVARGVADEHLGIPWCDRQCFSTDRDGKKTRIAQALPFWRFAS